MSDFLPIGSVVLLGDTDPEIVMIAGYLPREEGKGVSDYFGVPYPLGMLTPSAYVCFQKRKISEVLHRGFCDENGQKLLNGLDQFEQNLVNAIQQMKAGDQDG